jgi:hypothetical protein
MGVDSLFVDELTLLIDKIRPLFVSFAPDTRIVNNRGLWLYPNKGPITTIRTLANDNIEDFSFFKNWQPSIGSMELF